jgi:flagellar protein FliO/FliZ
MNRRAASAALIFPAAAMAEEAGRTAAKGLPAVDWVQWSLGLLLVLASIVFMAFLLRRLGNFSRMEAGRFKVLAALSLGARERVVLVQVGDKQLVLGVAPGRVQSLCVLEGEELVRPQTPTPAEESFAARLASLWSERRP